MVTAMAREEGDGMAGWKDCDVDGRRGGTIRPIGDLFKDVDLAFDLEM
jgi:hypothetical protein